MDIKEGLISNVAEIMKVSKQISMPFSKYLSDLENHRMYDDHNMVRAKLAKFEKQIQASKLKTKMKERYINNMRTDVYATMYDVGQLDGSQIKRIFKWSDQVYYPIIQAYSTK